MSQLHLPAPLAAVVAIFHNDSLRRVLLAFMGFSVAEWGTWIAILVHAYGRGGATETGPLAIGAILAPALISLAGAKGAFILAGSLLLVVTLVSWRALRAVDSVGVARPRELELLRRIPIFAPPVERLAARLVPVHAHPGSVVIRQGDPGDHFYIVVSGRVAISVDGRRVRDEGPGESFGEIALLREVPRTATVEALEGTELLALERRAFLEAITGQPASAETAEQVVRERLRVREEEADASA